MKFVSPGQESFENKQEIICQQTTDQYNATCSVPIKNSKFRQSHPRLDFPVHPEWSSP
jgi:hypothetical protein